VSSSGSLGDDHVIGGVELVGGHVLPVPGGGGGQSVDDASGLGVGSGKSAHGEKSACNGWKRQRRARTIR
jgi:hypothetical protein